MCLEYIRNFFQTQDSDLVKVYGIGIYVYKYADPDTSIEKSTKSYELKII